MKTKLTLIAAFAALTASAVYMPCLRPGVMAPVYPTTPGSIAYAWAWIGTSNNGSITLNVEGSSFAPMTWRAFSTYVDKGVYLPISEIVKTNATSIILKEIVLPCSYGVKPTYVIVMCTNPENGALVAVNEAFIK